MAARYARLLAGEILPTDDTQHLHKDGHLVSVAVSAAPIRDRAGRIVSYSAIYHDLTERQRVEAALRNSYHALQSALDVANMAVWGWDEVEQAKTWSAEALQIAGLAPDQIMTKERFLSLLHPADLARYEAAWRGAINPAGPRTYTLDSRIRRADTGA